jgi:hypothetical protein
MLCKLLLLYTLVLARDSDDLCKCPTKPDRMKSVHFCGNIIHKDCDEQTIYRCEYNGENSTIKVYKDCKKIKRRCFPRTCRAGNYTGTCLEHSCTGLLQEGV